MTATTVARQADAGLGFTSLQEETAVDRLPVTGEVPAWLTGALVRVTPSAPGYPGEPTFVRPPGDEAEDGGVVLSVALDTAAGGSFLRVLDARSFEELARAEAPHHIPFGFHEYLR